jgi:hypothetical protein
MSKYKDRMQGITIMVPRAIHALFVRLAEYDERPMAYHLRRACELYLERPDIAALLAEAEAEKETAA